MRRRAGKGRATSVARERERVGKAAVAVKDETTSLKALPALPPPCVGFRRVRDNPGCQAGHAECGHVHQRQRTSPIAGLARGKSPRTPPPAPRRQRIPSLSSLPRTVRDLRRPANPVGGAKKPPWIPVGAELAYVRASGEEVPFAACEPPLWRAVYFALVDSFRDGSLTSLGLVWSVGAPVTAGMPAEENSGAHL